MENNVSDTSKHGSRINQNGVFFKDKTYLRFEANYNECKENDNYKLPQSNMAQQTLRAVDFVFKYFFGSVGKGKPARPPRYRKKGGLYNLIITGNSISVQDGYLTVPHSRTYTSVLNSHRIRIKVPEQVNEEDLQLNPGNALAVGIGLDNPATCVDQFRDFVHHGRTQNQTNQSKLEQTPLTFYQF